MLVQYISPCLFQTLPSCSSPPSFKIQSLNLVSAFRNVKAHHLQLSKAKNRGFYTLFCTENCAQPKVKCLEPPFLDSVPHGLSSSGERGILRKYCAYYSGDGSGIRVDGFERLCISCCHILELFFPSVSRDCLMNFLKMFVCGKIHWDVKTPNWVTNLNNAELIATGKCSLCTSLGSHMHLVAMQ